MVLSLENCSTLLALPVLALDFSFEISGCFFFPSRKAKSEMMDCRQIPLVMKKYTVEVGRIGTVIHFYFGTDLTSVISVQMFFT